MKVNTNLRNYIKGDYAKVKVHTEGLYIKQEQKDRIVNGIELVINNSQCAFNNDEIGLREEIHNFFDMIHKNDEISDNIVSNIDYTIVFK